MQYPSSRLLRGLAYKRADMGPGAGLHIANCALCHGTTGVNNGGAIPNLGYVPASIISHLKSYVIDGPLTEGGMPDFAGKLSDVQITQITAFIQGTADSVRPKAAATTPAAPQ